MPTVTIHYSGSEPQVIVDPPDSVTIVLVDDMADDTRLLTYKGVEVFQALKDTDPDSYRVADYWCALYPGIFWESEQAFDVRDLPSPPEGWASEDGRIDPEEESELAALAYAIEQGALADYE